MHKSSDKITYIVADTFLLRAPLMPLSTLRDLSAADNADEVLRMYFSREDIAEAIFLASPEVFQIARKWIEDGAEDKKMRNTLMKYLIRMSSRCTPFGLFAGICPGTFDEKSKIMLLPMAGHHLHLRPDMQFLCSLATKIIDDPEVREQMKFRLNTSLYRFGDEYRYVEYETDEGGMRRYKLQGVRHSPELESVISLAPGGATIAEMLVAIMDEEVSREEAEAFIHLLIDNQVLVSDLEPSVTGEGYFASLKRSVDGIGVKNPSIQLLGKVSDRLLRLHSLKGSSRIKVFEQLISEVKRSEIHFKENALIQADLKLNAGECYLSESIRSELVSIIPVLGKLSRPEHNVLLDRFKENFVRRYDDQEVPLSLALDAEAGPGYLPDDQSSGSSSLLEGILIPKKQADGVDKKWTSLDRMLYQKLQASLMEGKYEISINDEDLQILPEPGQNFPASFSMMARIIDADGKGSENHSIFIESAGGSSALKLAGRFGYLDESLQNSMLGIADTEQKLYADHILAEIVHLPQQRTGNVLLRPVLCKYEIPYLAKAGVPDEDCLLISDLMVSIKNNKVFLRSKKLNQYILPRLSNAHNYTAASLSMYHFLCDLQSQDVRTGIGFSWGSLEDDTIFKPRISYKSLILSRAGWNLSSGHLKGIVDAKSSAGLGGAINELRKKFRIPREIVLVDGDNELWLDLESRHCIQLFQNVIRKRTGVFLQEFLSPAKGLVESEDGYRANEFVFFIHRSR